MKPRFFRSLFLLLILNLLIKPFWLLGIERTVQNLVGTESYGLFAALTNLAFAAQIVLDPGLHTFNNKGIAQNPEKLSEYLSRFLPLKIILSVVYIVLTLVIGAAVGFQGQAILILGWISVNQVLSSVILYMRSNLAGLYLFNTDSIFSVLDRLLMIFICAALIWGHLLPGSFRIEWFIYAQSVAMGIAAIASGAVVLRRTKYFKPVLSSKRWLSLFRQTYPFALLGILMTLYSRIDSVMLERMLPDGAHAAGIYASAYRLLDAANMIAYLFATILLPVFSGMIHRKESVGDVVKTSFNLLLTGATIIVCASYFFNYPIMNLLYRESDPQVFGWLMLTFPALCMVYIYGTLLTANGSLRFLNISSAIGVAGNVVLNIILIPKYQVMGAVIATLVTQYGVSFSQMIYANRVFGIKYGLTQNMKAIAFVVVTVLMFGLWQVTGAVSWKVALPALTAISLTFALVIGLLKFRSIFNYQKV